ncbi:hypothetical protein [Pseudomonas sp. EGD-AK9]|uniref:hypothetical protein n=1 Tax=Pseudomonas sp. EGD-AK9 TaxID=1386078 RepID=UPI0012E25FE8|nr:hypothetical protein [Pseudomonas sp. EGD-AK9]
MFSSREIQRRCRQDLVFTFIAQMQCPDFRVLSDFRKNHMAFFYDCFRQSVQMALELKLASLGHISLDGSKFEANTSGGRCCFCSVTRTALQMQVMVFSLQRDCVRPGGAR